VVGELRATHNIMQIVIEIKNNHVICKSNSCRNGSVEFLLDTGSSVNIIQLQCLKDEVKLLPGEKIYLKGINNTLVETIGIVEIPLTFGTFTIDKIQFYIVKDDVPLIKSGILGQIFRKEHKALIDMANDTIIINQVKEVIKIPPE